MIYTEQKERSYRFALALRMGLPIFFFSAVTLFALFAQPHTTLHSLITLSIILLGVMIYFIFYLIYQSSQESITDSITHTFLPDYFFKLFDKALDQQPQTLMMLNIENLWSINERYGVKNGDSILRNTVARVNAFFNAKGITKLPISRYKGGEFLLFFPGHKEDYTALLELLLTKYQNHVDNEIEIHLEATIVDTRLSGDIDMLIGRLYELYHDRLHTEKEEIYSISELEKEIDEALEAKRIAIGFWPVCCDADTLYDTTVKLIDSEGKFIHQSRYIPVLNRLNAMRKFESTVLEMAGSIADETKIRIVVSISSVTLRNPHFFEQAVTLFERYPNAQNRITLMFEEKEYCHQFERFRQQIAYYRKAGYTIAIDRLGGYHTTMLYLKELSIDMARFDAVYSRHITEPGYQNIIQGLNLSAHLCGAKTWMPMIEEESSDRLAQSLKINYRQGNYLGKILTLEELKGKKDEIR